MKRILLFAVLACALLLPDHIQAQVTIGSNVAPNPNSILDLKNQADELRSTKGLLLPRVALIETTNPSPLTQHVAGMTVYNMTVSPGGIGVNTYVSPGFYYNDGTKWVRLPMGTTNWFYMPSVSFDTSVSATGLTKDLYALYNAQFSAPKIKSAGAPVSVPYIPAATDLYYYITDYDAAVFSNISITADGKMTYDVTGSTTTDCSYINIVFVLK